MSTMKRRSFLQVAGGAALGTVGFLYPGAADAARQAGASRGLRTIEAPQGVDPTYAGGEVIAKTADGLVLQTPETARAVRLPPDTVVWKEFEGTADLIRIGDYVDVKGEPQTDGSLLAKSGMVFVNIGRRDGVIEELGANGIKLRRHDGRGDWQIGLSRALEVIERDTGAALAGGLAALSVGQSIGAVGLLLPNGGFRATRIWT